MAEVKTYPKTIYLIPDPSDLWEAVWSADPNPDGDLEEGDAIEYVRVEVLREAERALTLCGKTLRGMQDELHDEMRLHKDAKAEIQRLEAKNKRLTQMYAEVAQTWVGEK